MVEGCQNRGRKHRTLHHHQNDFRNAEKIHLGGE